MLCFGCVLEDFIVVIADLSDWMPNFSPPWTAYRALMACYLIAMDNHPGVHPIGIG